MIVCKYCKIELAYAGKVPYCSPKCMYRDRWGTPPLSPEGIKARHEAESITAEARQ